jgi:hypothetical protein
MRAEWSECRRAAEERDELTSPHNPLREPNQPCDERSLAQISPALALRHRPPPSYATPAAYNADARPVGIQEALQLRFAFWRRDRRVDRSVVGRRLRHSRYGCILRLTLENASGV